MTGIRHVYPGGNTRYGFHSFYDHILPSEGQYKMILKGGPGVGKSSLMKAIGEYFSQQYNIEFHWCSSDNHSLDAVVVDHRICMLDGTHPHIVDARYPGAFDEIIPLGKHWDASLLREHREEIRSLTNRITQFFELAYYRLREAYLVYQEWEYYYTQARDESKVNRNVLALTEEFLAGAASSTLSPRHLFAAALTPEGIVTQAESLLTSDMRIFAVKGSPGSGKSKLFQYISEQCAKRSVYLEHYHNPFNPDELDLLIAPDHKVAVLDISGIVVDYEGRWTNRKYNRLLDFDQFLQNEVLDPWAKRINQAGDRLTSSIQDALGLIQRAKELHDELEGYYIKAMRFEELDELRYEIISRMEAMLSS